MKQKVWFIIALPIYLVALFFFWVWNLLWSHDYRQINGLYHSVAPDPRKVVRREVPQKVAHHKVANITKLQKTSQSSAKITVKRLSRRRMHKIQWLEDLWKK